MFDIRNNSTKNIDKYRDLIENFLQYAQDKHDLDDDCVIIFSSDKENSENPLGDTAYYAPPKKTIVAYVDGRHIKDILRSISHELVHHKQNKEGRLKNINAKENYAQEDEYLRDIEKEAYKLGNITFRDWEDKFKSRSSNNMSEDNSKKKPYRQYINESRYEMVMKKFGFLNEDDSMFESKRENKDDDSVVSREYEPKTEEEEVDREEDWDYNPSPGAVEDEKYVEEAAKQYQNEGEHEITEKEYKALKGMDKYKKGEKGFDKSACIEDLEGKEGIDDPAAVCRAAEIAHTGEAGPTREGNKEEMNEEEIIDKKVTDITSFRGYDTAQDKFSKNDNLDPQEVSKLEEFVFENCPSIEVVKDGPMYEFIPNISEPESESEKIRYWGTAFIANAENGKIYFVDKINKRVQGVTTEAETAIKILKGMEEEANELEERQFRGDVEPQASRAAMHNKRVRERRSRDDVEPDASRAAMHNKRVRESVEKKVREMIKEKIKERKKLQEGERTYKECEGCGWDGWNKRDRCPKCAVRLHESKEKGEEIKNKMINEIKKKVIGNIVKDKIKDEYLSEANEEE